MPLVFEGDYKRRGNAWASRASSLVARGGGDRASVEDGEVGEGAGGNAARDKSVSVDSDLSRPPMPTDRTVEKEPSALATNCKSKLGRGLENACSARRGISELQGSGFDTYASESAALVRARRGASANRTHQLRLHQQLQNELIKTQVELENALASAGLAEKKAAQMEWELGETRLERDNALAYADVAEKRSVQLERDCRDTITGQRIQMQTRVDSSGVEARGVLEELARLKRWKERAEHDLIQKEQEIQQMQHSRNQCDILLEDENRRLQDSIASLQDGNTFLERENHRLRGELEGQKSLIDELFTNLRRLRSSSSQSPAGRRAADTGTSATALLPAAHSDRVRSRSSVRHQATGEDPESATPRASPAPPPPPRRGGSSRGFPPALAPASARTRSGTVLFDPPQGLWAANAHGQDSLHGATAGTGRTSRPTADSTYSPLARESLPAPAACGAAKRVAREAAELQKNNSRFSDEFYAYRGGRRRRPRKHASPPKRSSPGDRLARLEEAVVDTRAAASTARARGAAGSAKPDRSPTPALGGMTPGISPPTSQAVTASRRANKPPRPSKSSSSAALSHASLPSSSQKRKLRSFRDDGDASYSLGTQCFAAAPSHVSGSRTDAFAASDPSKKKRRVVIEGLESEASGDGTELASATIRKLRN